MTGPGLSEQALLPEDPGLAARLAAGEGPPGLGAFQRIEPVARIGTNGALDVVLVCLNDALCDLATGAVMAADGQVPRAPMQEIADPDLALALARQDAGQAQRRPSALIWNPAGGRNYGHFIFDGLTGLMAAHDLGLTARFAPLSAPLSGWQRDLVGRLRVGPVEEVGGRRPVLRVDRLIYLSTLDHYLQYNGPLLARVAARLGRPAAPLPPGTGAALYLTRGPYAKRLLRGEAALLARLVAAGVRPIAPHRMSIRAQAAAMAGASVVIAPSGAALANAVFLPPGATIIELRPAVIREPWLIATAQSLNLRLVRVDARPDPGARDLRADLLQLPRRLLRRAAHQYRVDEGAVLDALATARGA